MRVGTIPNVYRNVNRWREILSILSKYGLADWLSRFEFSFGKAWLKNRDGQQLADASRETRIRLALEELGPTFIKLGQIMSTRPDLVGADLAAELEHLQSNVPCDPPDTVRQFVEEEFGVPPEALFAEFNDVPVASASIGQVHRAELLTGETVAVKIQRAGIEKRVRVDLDILSGLAQLAERIPDLEAYRPTAAVAEFQRALRRELDFDRERRNIEEFRRAFVDNLIVHIPRTYPDYCTDRVLVMEWMEGVPLNSPRLGDCEIDLTVAARRGTEIYMEMIFRHGLFHADPHGGNMLLTDDGGVALLDYGMVGRLDESLREDIEDLLSAIVEQDGQQLAAVVMHVGATPAGLDESALSVDLADFVGHYAHQSVDHFEFSAALTEMFDIIRRHGIVLPGAMSMLLKVLIMLEGTGQRLEPQFSLMEVLAPYRKRMIARRMSPRRQWRKARRIVYELEQLAEVFPRRMRDILQQVQTGRFDVHLDHRGLEPSVNRMVLGLLTSALFIGSVQLVTNDVWPLPWLGGTSAPGLLGVGMSAALGLRLLRAINKSGHLDRR